MRTEAETEVTGLPAKGCQQHRHWRTRGRTIPWSVALTPCFWASSAQNCDRIHFCRFKPTLRHFVTVALGASLRGGGLQGRA